VSQLIDVVRDYLPNADLLELEGVDETEVGISVAGSERAKATMSSLLELQRLISQYLPLSSPGSALAGAASPNSVKDATVALHLKSRILSRKAGCCTY
jgi:hypothetical protein